MVNASPLTVALVGNPNAGKSTLFNALSGLRQHVGNYSGVTVEMKKGTLTHVGRTLEIIDLPGTVSLAARSPDERVAVDLLLGRVPGEPKPDVIVAIVDASNLDRHLYLTTQLMDLGVPMVLAVNMVDLATGQGMTFDWMGLADAIGLAVIPIQAHRQVGLEALKDAIVNARTAPTPLVMPKPVRLETGIIVETLGNTIPPVLATRLLLDIDGDLERHLVPRHDGLARKLVAARTRLAEAGFAVPAAEARLRYGWIREITAKCISQPAVRPASLTDTLDRVLTHRLWGTLVFLAVMLVMFVSIYILAQPAMDAIAGGFDAIGDLVRKSMAAGPLRALLADGIVGGVGSVVVFLPQILILFLFIAVLEDCGYMARAAFLMDKLMSRCGLSGKSFIPLLSSVACAVPGIMATRTIEQPRDRLATILVAPLMSCSARLPVYLLLIGAFLGPGSGYATWVPGVTLFGLYLVGFVLAPLLALLFKRTMLRGATPAYIMVLPVYQRPRLGSVLRRMFDAGWAFLKRAGTLILANMVLVWAVLYFPAVNAAGEGYEGLIEEAKASDNDDLANQLKGEWKRRSYLGQAGVTLEPVFAPLGWDWKIGMATLASFPAREVIVGTLGIVYDRGGVDPGESPEREQLGIAIRQEWKDDPVRGRYGVPVAVSVMVFFALCCQCVSTLAVIRRETRSWFWPAFTFAYMTLLAYAAAFAVYQIGKLLVDAG